MARIASAVARVQALASGHARIADAPVTLPAFDAMEPKAAHGLALSPTTLGLIERAVQDAAQAPSLCAALEIGYRLIDTASAYGNEAAVGRAIAASASSNEAGYITHKVVRSLGMLAFDNQARV